MSPECIWRIEHLGHLAWYQRALVAGDFAPGRVPISEYIVDEFGRSANPLSTPKCLTCGVVPGVDDLQSEEVTTKRRGQLHRYRLLMGNPVRLPWPEPTDPTTCFWCNSPTAPVVTVGVRLCVGCAAHLEMTARRR